MATKGLEVTTAAKLIGEITGICRFDSDAQLARMRLGPGLIRPH
jgi:hypothetical protein